MKSITYAVVLNDDGCMKEVEYFIFWTPPDPWRKRGGRTTYKLTREEALKRYGPLAKPEMVTRELRRVYEPGDKVPMHSIDSAPPGGGHFWSLELYAKEPTEGTE